MAVASYTTDLADFETFEGTPGGSLVEMTNFTTTQQNTFADDDTDNPIQSNTHGSVAQRTAGAGSIVFDRTTGVTLAAGEAFFIWANFLQSQAVDTFTNDGIVGFVGTGTGAYYVWTIGGSDFGRNPYGGYANYVIDPTITTGRTTQGSPGTTYTHVGWGANVIAAIAKGSPFNIDAIRYGRGEVIVTGGTTPDPAAEFDSLAAQNDAVANRWGLFSEQFGSYLWKGLISLGTSATAVDFQAANRIITIDNTLRVAAGFNRIEINNTSSNIDWDAINITSLSTVSRGQFEMIDGATLDFNTCVFTDMDTFIFNKGTGACNLLNNTWRRCRAITQGGATFTNCLFDNTDSGATESLISTTTTISLITNCDFNRASGTVNAVFIDNITTTGTLTWSGNSLTGYGSQTVGTGISSTAGGALRLRFTSGTPTITISVVSGATVPTVEIVNAGGTGTVNIEQNVGITIDVKDAGGTAINGAQVAVFNETTGATITNQLTDSSGNFSSVVTTAANTPIVLRVRKSTTGSTRYIPIETTTNTGATGVSVSVTLVEDELVEL